MQIQFSDRTKYIALGAVIGAAALAMIGYSWDLFLLPEERETMANRRATEAVAVALAPYCVERFKSDPNANANLSELKKLDQWQRASFIEKGGWTKGPGGRSPDSSVAEKCAEALLGPKTTAPEPVGKP